MRLLSLLLAALAGAIIGTAMGAAIGVSYLCARSWYEGGSADPRCAAATGIIKGYVEVHNVDFKPARISCVYEPQVGAP